MPLVLKKSIKDCTRQEMEDFIEAVRVRRMLATIEYHNLKNAKLSQATGKIQARVDRECDLLEKEINTLERAEQKVEDRLNKIEQMKQEIGLLVDQIVDPNEDVE